MTTALIVLETRDLVAASRLLRLWAAAPLETSTDALSRTLEGCGGMAGDDPGGVAWATAYDGAAVPALSATADAVNGVDRLAGMFAQTARNYEVADAASTASNRRLVEAAVDTLPSAGGYYGLPVCVPPPAAGGAGGPPAGWGLVSNVVGYAWPNGHQDLLRVAARAWTGSAAALQNAADEVFGAPQLAITDQLPEAADMWTVCRATSGQLRELAALHRALGAACEELARHLDEAHSAVEGELASLVEWTAGLELAGGLLSVVSLGLAELPTQAGEAARIAATAARVSQLLERFLALARAGAQSVATLTERAGAVSARLRVLLDTRLTEAAVLAVGVYRNIRLSDETTAIGRIARDSEADVVGYADRVSARNGLPGELREASNRFFRKATSKSTDFRITGFGDGGFRMEFFSPADNPGYGKLYVETIGKGGEVVTRFKDTVGPDGLIERKWLIGGPE